MKRLPARRCKGVSNDATKRGSSGFRRCQLHRLLQICTRCQGPSVDRGDICLVRSVPESARPGQRLPVCAELDQTLAIDTADAAIANLINCFKTIEPRLEWRRRSNNSGTASENFRRRPCKRDNIGPAGLEPRSDVWLGATLMAPNVRYPDHDHAPRRSIGPDQRRVSPGRRPGSHPVSAARSTIRRGSNTRCDRSTRRSSPSVRQNRKRTRRRLDKMIGEAR